MKYKSIIGYGKLEEVDDFNEKKKGLSVVMKHYSGKETWEFPEKNTKKVLVLKVKIETISGKKYGWR